MILSATGHRDIDADEHCAALIRTKLKRLQPELVIIGCAKGFDTLVGWACVDLKIPFDMYLPFEGSYYDRELRKHARLFLVISSGGYEKKKYAIRDKVMVDVSESVIAWYDGRLFGGTYLTVQYAKSQNKEVLNLYEIC